MARGQALLSGFRKMICTGVSLPESSGWMRMGRRRLGKLGWKLRVRICIM